MINLEKLLENFEENIKSLVLRGVNNNSINYLKEKFLEKKRLINVLNKLRREHNKNEKKSFSEEAKKLKNEIKNYEEKFKIVSKELNKIHEKMPNITSSSVSLENKIVKTKSFDNKLNNSLNYEDIIKKIGIVDFKSSAKISGSKFVIYNEKGTKLINSLINFMLSENNKNGYSLLTVPCIVNKRSLYNTGQLPKFSEDIFNIENTNFALIPTAEVSLINIYSNEIIKEENLPIKLCSYTPCFRAEVGSAGKENSSLIRLHQFNKVELVKITKPEDSYKELEFLVEDACKILEKLEITYRVVNLSFSELGISSAKTYDIELWMPNSKKWTEISSCSNCEEFQSNRSKIRGKIKGKNITLHTLNGSSLAIDRLVAAILEYYYNEKNNEIDIPNNLKLFFSIFN